MMRDYVESGDYTTSDNGSIVPPTDTATFNGHVWLDALRTHSSSAEALAQYEQRAIRPELQWSWKNARLQWDLFSQLTREAKRRQPGGRPRSIALGREPSPEHGRRVRYLPGSGSSCGRGRSVARRQFLVVTHVTRDSRRGRCFRLLTVILSTSILPPYPTR